MHKLVIEDDEGKQTVVPIIRDAITIGRMDGNTIRLTERNVSRHHGRLSRTNGQLYFENVRARYGSLKNGQKVEGRVEFSTGDVFTVGDYRLYIHTGDAPPRSPRTATGEPDRDSTTVLPIQRIAPPAQQTQGPARLVVLNTEYAGSEFLLNVDDLVIGRTSDNDICIDHRSISRNHSRIQRVEGAFRVTDMGSANGIRVNGEPYMTIDLRRGDVLELGNVKMRFVAPGETFTFTPTAEDRKDGAKGGMGKIVALLVFLLVAAVGGIVIATSGGSGGDDGDESSSSNDNGEQSSANVQVNDEQRDNQNATNRDGPGQETANVQEPVEIPDNSDFSSVIAAGQDQIDNGQWDQAIETLSVVPVSDPAYNGADQLINQARRERRHQSTYDNITSAESARNFGEALGMLNDIPEDSYYHGQLEGAEARMRESWMAVALSESATQLEAGNYDAARAAVAGIEPYFPNDDRINEQLATIDQAEADAAVVASQNRDQEREDRARDREARRERERARERENEPDEEPDEEPDDEPEEMSRADRESRADELMRTARRLGIQGRHREAIDSLEEAEDLNPREDSIHLMLYTNYSRIGNDRRAARSLREYVRRRPNDPNVPEYREIIEQLEEN